jgi:hypothetical protein
VKIRDAYLLYRKGEMTWERLTELVDEGLERYKRTGKV